MQVDAKLLLDYGFRELEVERYEEASRRYGALPAACRLCADHLHETVTFDGRRWSGGPSADQAQRRVRKLLDTIGAPRRNKQRPGGGGKP